MEEAGLGPLAVPVRRSGRWHLIDQGALVLVVLVAFLAVAIVKPWQAAATPSVAEAVPSRSPSPPSPTPGPVAEPAVRPGVVGRDQQAFGDAVRALRTRHGWGIRALVDDGPRADDRAPHGDGDTRRALREVWLPAPWDGASWWSWGGGPASADPLVVPNDGRDVAALGVTSPPESPLLDVRAWRMTGGATRLPVRRVEGVAASSILLLPPSAPGAPARWEPDVYRLDVLTAREVRRITVVVGGTPRPVAAMPAPPAFSTGALLAAMDGLRPGLVVIRSPRDPASGGPVAERRDARPRPALTEAGAWLMLGRQGAAPPVHEFAGPGVGRTVVGIGVRPASDVEFIGATLSQYGTDEPPLEATAITVAGQPGGPSVLFRAGPAGFGPGTYRIDLRPADARGAVSSRSHHIELRAEGASPIAPPLLRAVRRHSRLAGEWSILGGVEPHRMVRPVDDRPDPDDLGPTCRGGAMVPAESRVVGVAFPPDAADDVVVGRILVGGRSVTFGATVADQTIPGVAILAPREAGGWPAGYYSATLLDGERTRSLPFCVGERTPRGLRVPGAAASIDASRFEVDHTPLRPAPSGRLQQ
jgi:hypothetical protein